ncbi:MAG: LysE family transporter [Rhodospirillales bacterium]|nr:LysE family transporter [Rhodospirillales bacterium]
MVLLFLKSLAIGLAVALPMGPIGVLIVRRTLVLGLARGLEGGVGVAVADGLHAAMAAFGVTAVTALLAEQQTWFQAIGGAALLWIGVAIMRKPAPVQDGGKRGDVGGGFGVMFGLTLANPATILSFAAIFASLGPIADGGVASAIAMTLGVFLGSLGWWVVLTGAVGALRTHITASVMLWLSRGAGALIVCFGLAALAAAVWA